LSETNKEVREERKRRETQDLREELEDLKAEMPQLIDDAVGKRVNELMPTVLQSLTAWFAGGQQGPVPMISLGASNSHNVAPAQNAPLILETPAANPAPAANNAGAREDSPALIMPASSPSVSCMPTRGPSTFAELDAITIIN
jgi:hypothetical protein